MNKSDIVKITHGLMENISFVKCNPLNLFDIDIITTKISLSKISQYENGLIYEFIYI